MALRKLLVGVDVGGTNSDLVVIDPKQLSSPNRGVLAWNKTVTTDVSKSIENGLRVILEDPDNDITKEEIVSVTIGTTHFINAVIERNTSRLDKVAIIRLCGPYGGGLPPFGDFPEDLAEILNGYVASIDGGLQVNGDPIRALDEQALQLHCRKIRELGIKVVAVIGTFANINNEHELRAQEIIQKEIPGIEVVLSHTISSIGFLERENATILNASIRRFGKYIISSFIRATRAIGLKCTVLLSQNDGTVLSTKDALEIPIRTFSSGATNSMRGASILCSSDPEVWQKTVIVCDVGGTTTDVGLLLPSGFPRQSSTYSYAGGVKMNFSMPHVLSVGLGGGSIVRKEENGNVNVGPDSTGADIIKSALLFGGDTITATDVTVGSIVDSQGITSIADDYKIGNPSLCLKKFDSNLKDLYKQAVVARLESLIDRIKTSPDDIPVVFVGGGSIIAPNTIKGASKVIRPPFYQVANAIGAAISKISAEVHEMKTLENPSKEKDAIINVLFDRAKKLAISKGALADSLTFVSVQCEEVPYVDRVYSFSVRVVGDVDYEKALYFTESNMNIAAPSHQEFEIVERDCCYKKCNKLDYKGSGLFSPDIVNYRPTVRDGEWILSVIDVEFISIGAYILGCGGGGDPNPDTIELKRIVRDGGIIRVLTLDEFEKRTNGKGRAINVGYFGSPTISNERLHANEILEALALIERWEGRSTDGIVMFEIGGSNGLSALWTAYKQNQPCIDLDLMGRAYPTQWQSLPSVYHDLKGYPHLALADGNGMSLLLTNAVNDVQMENLIRDAMYHNGVQCAVVGASMNIEQMRRESVANTLSLSWKIGKAVASARIKSDIDNIPRYIIDAAGGSESAKCLFKGKIIGVERKLDRGYGYGVVKIGGIDEYSKSAMKIPFKNENIVAYKIDLDNPEEEVPICSVPDLITLIDTDGSAVGTQDYRYGLIVFVMAFAPCDKWTTPKGIKIGGPLGFGKVFEQIEYCPIGKYVKPVPVSDEYSNLKEHKDITT